MAKVAKWKMVKGVKSFTIDRAKWLSGVYGEYFNGSMLYRPEDGRMCCLGFYCEASGIPKKKMANVPMPAELALGNIPSWLRNLNDDAFSWSSSDAASDIARMNDDIKKRTQREAAITRAFAKQGVKVRFVGDWIPCRP